jgi:gamma-glutamyl:cysteine ligase YbdK (ATP-grasp superfamily)
VYKSLEVLGPEHELALVDDSLKPLPIADKVIKAYCGKIINFAELDDFTFGKEMQLHVMEIKANHPFTSPITFEQTMQNAVSTLSEFVSEKFGAHLLGTGMHPLLTLDQTGVWPHYHRKIYRAYSQVFNLKQHGWLNIQSFHLNLPYKTPAEGIVMHNLLANLCPYLSAVAAASPTYEGTLKETVDNRLEFYKINQREVPSVTGDVVPEYVSSIDDYKKNVIGKFSQDLARAGASQTLLYKEWVNSRGVIFRFDRCALEVRVMDEQECIKMDVALGCFIRACLRSWMVSKPELLPHDLLVRDLNAIIKAGLSAKVEHPYGKTARDICTHLYQTAWANATPEEKMYLPLVQKRIVDGNLSDLIRQNVNKAMRHVDSTDAIRKIYSTLIRCLITNQPYS